MKSTAKTTKSTSSRVLESHRNLAIPGYRLSRLEIYNWGTFDGAVYSIAPDGCATLLVGENGSGKSTVIDALLTLLVRPQTRNYNVAAGAGKQERDERTYCRGAYDRTITADGKSQIQYLRPNSGTYTALLAVFSNADPHAEPTSSSGTHRNTVSNNEHRLSIEHEAFTEDKEFTIAQILYMNADNGCERVYATSDGRRTIHDDLNGLQSGATMARQLKERGFEIHPSYQQYYQWLQRRTGLRSKAMDIFNQTVAVKDVQKLDTFIRQHMLEKHSWTDRLTKLLAHFHELSEAHRHLLRARQQSELLEPIAVAGADYRRQLERVTDAHERMMALPSTIAASTVALLSPRVDEWQQKIEHHRVCADRIALVLEQKRREIARIEVQIEDNKTPSVDSSPNRIDYLEQCIATYRRTTSRSEELLQRLGLPIRITSKTDLAPIREQLANRKSSIHQNRRSLIKQRDEANRCISTLQQQLQQYQDSITFLKANQTKLPESLVSVRDAICDHLRISKTELPFVAELIAISPDQQAWADSIEHVLHGFARSLLVPESHYQRVSRYIEGNRLIDSKGHGQRLVYLRIPTTPVSQPTKTIHAESKLSRLPEKLHFREHAMTKWLQVELSNRFNVAACESIEEFQRTPPPAMTIHRHFKIGPHRHEKSDRTTNDGYSKHQHGLHVLGWRTSDATEELRQSISADNAKLDYFTREIERLSKEEEHLVGELVAIDQLLPLETVHLDQLAEYETELERIRSSMGPSEIQSDATAPWKARMTSLRQEVARLQDERDAHLGKRTQWTLESNQGAALLKRAQQQLDSADASPRGPRQETLRRELLLEVDSRWTLEELQSQAIEWETAFRKRYDQALEKLQPLNKELTARMARYLRAFPEAGEDLDPDVASLASFEALHQKLKTDDLPRYESRFKDRLNEKVLHEVGLFYSSLENDRQEIREKLEQLNQALRQLEWKPGTHMRLEANDVSDREIREFRKELTSCLDRTLDASPEANEESFIKIEKLIEKLRDPAAERWRDKVVDVRNWFSFAAREIVNETGESRSYYEGGGGQSGGEKGKLAFLVLVAAIAYQYDLDPNQNEGNRFHFVMVDEMFSRSDDAHAEYALDLFHRFGLQLLIVAPLDAKVRVTEPYVGTYIQVLKNKQTNRSSLVTITAEQIERK